jgi:hypothetical protein
MKRSCGILGVGLLVVSAQLLVAEPCRVIHGRAILYSGDGFLEIWHIGTHHTFFVVDDKSSDLILNYIPYEDDGHLKALFADFTVCPTAKYRKGASQETIVRKVQNPHVVLDPFRSGALK